MNEEKIIKVTVPIGDAIAQITALTAEMTKLKAVQDSNTQSTEKDRQQYEANKIVIKDYANQKRQLTNEVSKEIQSNNQALGAYQKLQNEYSKAAANAKNVAAAQGLNSAASIKASEAANLLNDKLKAIDKSVGQNQRSVGDYGIALKGLPGIFGEMAEKGQAVLVKLRTTFASVSDATMQYKEATQIAKSAQIESAVATQAAVIAETELATAEVAGTATAEMAATAEAARATATDAATVATELSSGAMKAFRIALAGTGIGLIVVALGSLIAYFTQTNEGSKLLSKSLAVVGAIFKELIGFVAKGVQGVRDFVEGIKDFPDLMTKIGNAIKENLLNRFKAFGLIFQAIGELLSGDFKKGLTDLANGWLQFGTGVENVIGKVGKMGDALGKGVADAAKDAAKIAEMKRELGKFERESLVAIAILEKNIGEYKVILGKAGQSLSVKEREDAINNTMRDEDKLISIKLNAAGKKRAIAKAELDLEQKQTGDAMGETKKAYAESQADYLKILGEYNVNRMTVDARSAKLYVQILTEQLTAEKDIYNQSKTVLNNKLKETNLSFEQQLKIIDDLKKAEQLSYQQQTESFQQFLNSTTKGKGEIINFNELIAISDGQLLQARMNELKLSIPAQKLMLTLLSDRKAAVTEINQSEIKIAKDRANELIAGLQNEIKLSDLKNKEIRAGRNSSFEEEKIDLINSYNDEQQQLDIKHDNDLVSEEQYLRDQAVLDQKYKADSVVLDAQISDQKKKNQLNDINNQLETARIGIDLETQLKKDALNSQMQDELRNTNLTESQRLNIIKKYETLARNLDRASLDFKLQIASQTANSLAAIFGKTTKAGKAAASAGIAIDSIAGAIKAFNSMASIPVVGPVLGGIAAAGVIATGIQSIKDVWAVSDTGTTGISGGSSASTPTLPPDTASKMASPLSGSVSGISSYGGANVITSGAATSTNISNQTPVIVKPVVELSLVELKRRQDQVNFIDNISSVKA